MDELQVSSGVAPRAQSASSGFDALSSDEFMEIVLTELGQQDPFEPQDTSALIQQLSDIRSIESDTNLADQLGTLVAQNELTAAAGLIGTVISGLDENGQRVIDYVSSVSRTPEGAVLNLRDGGRVPMSTVDEIVTEEELFGEPNDDEGGEA